MNFDDLDTMMRPFETCADHNVLPDIHMVARLDGKGFTKLTKRLNFEKPFDIKFSEIMRHTTHYLMKSTGFKFVYGYTQSDEISLLFAQDENTFGRKIRKLNSTLAGHASAAASIKAQEHLVFDCRISQLPTIDLIKDYFSWRQADATRNALIGYCYWTARAQGMSARKATSMMNGWGAAAKNEWLFQQGINFNDVTTWHKRGIGLYYEPYIKHGFNPITGQRTYVERVQLIEDDDLPMKEKYRNFVKNLYI